MRSNLLILSFLFISCCTLFAQPGNDDCDALTDLGTFPYCPDNEFFTNVNATESNIGLNNFPTGCSGAGDITFVGRDVWFQFTTGAATFDYTITVTGTDDGTGSTPLSNPQIVVYRGDCLFDELSTVGCGKAADGENEMAIDILGLDPSTPYFIRINDWSATAAENWGSFKLCVAELDPVYIMGTDTESTSCFGTLFDSGGETGDYGTNENFTFTICPNQFFSCLALELSSFDIENGFDELNIYAGADASAPLITSIDGSNTGVFDIEASSPCVTVTFSSDVSVVNTGFAMTWQCNAAPCDGSSISNPTVITALPFDGTGFSSCGEAATFASTPCSNDAFLNGPEYVFTYDSPGNICVSVNISNAVSGTGVLVLNGPPDDANTVCVAAGTAGVIGSANMDTPGTYYIIVANDGGCTNFDISIAEGECSFPPSLVDALCSPVNSCLNEDSNAPSQFTFESGFEDIDIVTGVNDGCWIGVGPQPDFVWFTIEAQQDGPFGFILESAGAPADIDFSVWGPFTATSVCDDPNSVIDIISTTQPIRSSWAALAGPTGLADIHPTDGTPVTDDFDCIGGPGAFGDRFCRTIPAQAGEHYVVLINVFGDIIEEAINVDWSPSGNGVLEIGNLAGDITGADTTLCAGQPAQLELPNWIDTVQWIDPTNTLSCTDCLDPIATPSETTTYTAIVEALCLIDTIKVEVFVYDADLGPDITICLGEEIPLSPDEIFDDVSYTWTGQNLSCTNCPATTISTNTVGMFEYTIELVTPNCTLTDEITVEVLATPAPVFEVSDSVAICIGSATSLGDNNNDSGLVYIWSSDPPGFNSTDFNPSASPTVTTTYYVAVSNGICPTPSMDSVFVFVDNLPIVELANDTTVCQSELVVLGSTVEEPGVTYSWSPDTNLDDANIANPTATVESTETYTLTATRGACVLTEEITVTASIISIDILNEPDTITICKGESVTLNLDVLPSGSTINWTVDNDTINLIGNPLIVSPGIITTYFASIETPSCMKMDTITIDVDSLPSPLAIMPTDTIVCAGSFVVLSSIPYLPGNYPEIEHEWTPLAGQESPDSLFNMVISTGVPTTYARETTNGVCTSIDTAFVDIQPTTTITVTPENGMICAGDEIQLVASSPDVTDFTWTPETNISCTECPNPTVTPSSTTTYMVEGEFEDCPVNTTVTVDVTPRPISGVIDNTSICQGEMIQLSTFIDTNPNTTFTWTSDPSGFFSNEGAPSDDPLENTTYMLTLDNGVCPPVTDQVTIEVVGDAAVTASEDVIFCDNQPQSVVLTAMGNSAGGTYTWSPTNSSGPTLTVNPNEPGVLEYEVTFVDICGGVATDVVNVTVLEAVDILDITPPNDSIYAEGDVVQVGVTTDPSNPAGASYSWSANGGEIGNTQSFPFTLVDPNYTFSISIDAENGCQSFASTMIEVVRADWIIPNAFTPDADGINDRFRIINTGAFEVKNFQIWDRWGELVFENEDPNGWDGTYKDKPMPMDVYIYHVTVIRPSGTEESMTGDVTLIR